MGRTLGICWADLGPEATGEAHQHQAEMESEEGSRAGDRSLGKRFGQTLNQE
jgi:hypothetical protein